jgi:hypothetical protein
MSLLKYFVWRIARPIVVVAGMATTVYGYQQWKFTTEALHAHDNQQEMLDLFDKLDRDHKGYVDKNDLRGALSESHLHTNFLALRLLLISADLDKDGKISRYDWSHLCHRMYSQLTVLPPDHDPSKKVKAVMKEQLYKDTHKPTHQQ